MTIDEARELVVKAGKRLVETGLIARTWGNVSCRLDESSFVITPSGRDYLSLTADKIVKVNIRDCSYTGDIKPSSEKGIHAEVYKLRPDIGFVIHTHQKNASAVSAAGLSAISNPGGAGLLGNEIPCALYALPGTKKLRRNVSAEVSRSKGNAVIMQNHGALCYGRDYEEAFTVASELEKVCDSFLSQKYLSMNGGHNFDEAQMRSFAISRLTGMTEVDVDCNVHPYSESRRTENGFKLFIGDEKEIEVADNSLNESLPKEAELYKAIYGKYKNINYIINAVAPDITAASCANTTIQPFLDDFAQLVGVSAKTIENDSVKIADALKHSSAVLIKNHGALCCGINKSDAAAVSMVMEKNCKAMIVAALFGKVKPLNPIECILMRYVYLKKYSKLHDS